MRKIRDFKITPKLIVSVILIASFFTALNSYSNYNVSKNNLRKSIQDDLTSIVQSKKEYLDKFLDYHKGRISDWSSDEAIRENFKKIAKNQDTNSILNLGDYIKDYKHYLVDRENEIVITDIFDLSGVVRVSTDPERIGHTESRDDLDREYNFSKAKAAEFGDAFFASLTHEPDEPGHLGNVPMWHVSTPLIPNRSDNEVIGVIVSHILAEGLNNVLLGDWQINSSMQGIELPRSYLVSSHDKLVVTPTGFNENMILEQLIDTEPVKKCAENKNGMIGTYKDHKGNSVIGASLCVGDDWTLLAEIKEVRLFSAMGNFKNNILIISILMILVLLIAMYLILSRNFIRPIKKLSIAAERMAKGDFSQRVEILSNNEIGRLSKTFNEMAQKIEETDRAKSEFVSLASHQLLTPLTTVSWYIETLLAGSVSGLSEKQKEYIKNVYSTNHNMVETVRALLDVSRIEMGTFYIKPQSVNIVDAANSVLDELTIRIKEKELEIIKDFDSNMPIVEMDPQLIRIIFQNLLSNAVKYTSNKGKVIISTKKQEQDILVSISDSGYGIPKELQEKVFSKFFRSYNIKEKVPEGTGLGLYIVKSIIDNSGGKIRFESEENKGTTFYVSYPLSGMKAKEGTKQLGA